MQTKFSKWQKECFSAGSKSFLLKKVLLSTSYICIFEMNKIKHILKLLIWANKQRTEAMVHCFTPFF